MSINTISLTLIVILQIAYSSDIDDGDKPQNSQDRGGKQLDYLDLNYGSKVHVPHKILGWKNPPTASKNVRPMVTGIRSTQHKKHETKSTNFKFVSNWPDPSKQLGSVAAVDIDTNGNVVVFHRVDRIWGSNTFAYNNVYKEKELGPIQQATILVFHATSGLIVEERGSNMFYIPHGLTIDFENNIWVTDVALHQVFKFPANQSLEWKPSLILGESFVPGNDDTHFCKPTDVAVLSNGDFFVSDGYCNSRIIKFDKNGKKIMEWGRSTFSGAIINGEKPPADHFLVPHAMAVDEESGTLFVADRENGRIQCFNTSSGIYIRQLHSLVMGPRIFSVAFAPVKGGLLYIVNGPTLGIGSIKVDGFVVSLASEEIVAHFNIDDSGFKNPHDVAVTKDGNQVYVVELNPYKVWKFVSGNINISIAGYPHKSENASNPGNITTASQNTYRNMPHHPGRGSVIATIAAISSVIVVIVIAVAVIILRIRRGASKHYSELEMRETLYD